MPRSPRATGVWVHARSAATWNGNWLAGWRPGSLPAAVSPCVVLLHFLGVDSRTVAGLITGSLGVALILTALAMLFKERLAATWPRARRSQGESWRERHVGRSDRRYGRRHRRAGHAEFGGSGGSWAWPLLFWLFPLLPASRIVGSDIAHAVPLTAVAGLGHLSMGTVDLAVCSATC